jgi:hypothetical protein
MLRVSRFVSILACLTTLAVPAAAQAPLTLSIQDGQVTLKAQNVPVATILNEWARIGGTNVIGANRVTGAPVTLELDGVPERQALEVLLRNVSGYLLALRPEGTSGASVFNRILIMPASAAPRPLPVPAPAVNQTRAPQGNDEGPGDIILEGPNPNRPAPAVRPAPFGGQNGQNGPPPTPLPVPETAAPVPPVTPGVVVTPSNPFGIPTGSSSRPGVVTPVPQQPQNQRPDPNQ